MPIPLKISFHMKKNMTHSRVTVLGMSIKNLTSLGSDLALVKDFKLHKVYAVISTALLGAKRDLEVWTYG